jgi:hypothetical protein
MGSRIREGKMEYKKNLNLIQIQGLIIPVDWDEEGNPISVAISTFHEEENLVEKDTKGDQLLGLLREEVKVSGEVWIEEEIKTIRVKKYMLIKKPELIDGILGEEAGNRARE